MGSRSGSRSRSQSRSRVPSKQGSKQASRRTSRHFEDEEECSEYEDDQECQDCGEDDCCPGGGVEICAETACGEDMEICVEICDDCPRRAAPKTCNSADNSGCPALNSMKALVVFSLVSALLWCKYGPADVGSKIQSAARSACHSGYRICSID